MSLRRKIAAFLVCVTAVMAMTVTSFAAENGDGYAESSGVVIETKTDKDTYTSGEKAEFTITVTNKNDYAIEDFGISYTVPENFEIKQSELPKKIDSLAAGESKTLSFSTVVTSDTKAPVNVTMIVIIAVAAVVVVAVVAFVIIKGKKKKTAAMILVAALLAGSVSAVMSGSQTANAEVKNSDYKRVSVHDPSIVKDPKTGTYYIFGSHMAWAKSDDLISWTPFTNNINRDVTTIFKDIWDNFCYTDKNPDLKGNMWAPDVIWNETLGKWCMYMSVNGENHQSAIVLLTADSLEGDWTYVGPVVFSGFGDSKARAEYSDAYKVLGEGADLSRYALDPVNAKSAKMNAIDPNVEYDKEGNLWMTYGSWSAGIYQLKIDLSTGLRDYNQTYELAAQKSDPYLGIKIAGGCYNSGEAPYIIKTDSYYYLFVTIGGLETSQGYNMRVYRSESINGPFVDEKGASAITSGFRADQGFVDDKTVSNKKKYTSPLGIKLMGSYSMYGTSMQIGAAQGHNSALVDDDGKIYLVYHSRFAGTSQGHEVRVHQLIQTETGWLTAAPYEYSGETISKEGYSAKDVAGTYDFLIHRQDVTYAYGSTDTTGESFFANTSKTITVNQEEVKLSIRASWLESVGRIYENKGIVYPYDITLNEDGTITGDYKGTWEFTNGANVKMTIDGVEYSGAFLEQQNELTSRDMTMTFSMVGGNKCVWGTKNPEKN